MRKKHKIITAGAILILALILLASRTSMFKAWNAERVNQETIKEIEKFTETVGIKKETPAKAYLEVQFICQAPLETEINWIPHEESCEEAALLMAYLYETNQALGKEAAHKEVLQMIDWQVEYMESHHDLYADEMKEFITGYYGLEDSQVLIIKNASLEDIKLQIAQNHPVIVPITGDILQNPYYPYPGYHMLTVIGYTEDRIITNDNGTRHGADFSYDNETFMKAMKDAGGDIIVLEME